MGYYKVNFGDYSLSHSDSCRYLNYFEFNGKKYPIGAYVNLTKDGEYQFLKDVGYNCVRGNFRLVDHFFTEKGVEKWEYIVARNGQLNYLRTTTKTPDEIITEVKCAEFDEKIERPGELKVEFKEPNYFPKDWEVEGVIVGWVIMAVVWILALLFKDWWIRLLIQISAGWYFGSWREKKMNEAIVKQKFKKRN